MDIAKLKVLITGLEAMSDDEALDWCNASTVDQEHRSLSGPQILEVTNGTEFAGKTAAEKNIWLGICAVESVIIANGSVLAKVAVDTFGGASTTVANLKALREFTNSPADDAGLGRVRLGHIIEARKV